MSTTSNAYPNPGRVGGVGDVTATDRAQAPAPSKAEVYARAEETMRRGKKLVISGFVVAIVGIVGYCAASLTSTVDPGQGAAFLEGPRWFVGPALGTVGLGTLLWLVGSYVYLSGTMDSDPDGPDLHF